MTTSLIDTIKKIQDSQPAEINLPLTDGSSVQLKCVYKEAFSPNFFLVFPPKQIPPNLDTSKSCLVVIKDVGRSISFKAGIEAVKGDRVMELFALKTIDPITLRTAYRADLRTTISASYQPAPEERAKAWSLTGETLDLSSGGTLAIFPAEFLNKQRIHLHIKLPSIDTEISCTSHVVNATRLRKERWKIALQFDDLSQKERDIIAFCCLKEQRRQLRENAFVA